MTVTMTMTGKIRYTVCPIDIGTSSRPNISALNQYIWAQIQIIWPIRPGELTTMLSRFPSMDFGENHQNFENFKKNYQILNIHQKDWCWSILQVLWVIWFESGLRYIDFRRRYWVANLSQYRWLVRYLRFLASFYFEWQTWFSYYSSIKIV